MSIPPYRFVVRHYSLILLLFSASPMNQVPTNCIIGRGRPKITTMWYLINLDTVLLFVKDR